MMFDVMIMDGVLFNVGVVVGLRCVKNVIGVVRVVMEYMRYIFLFGDLVMKFVKEMGFKEESLLILEMEERCRVWREGNC